MGPTSRPRSRSFQGRRAARPGSARDDDASATRVLVAMSGGSTHGRAAPTRCRARRDGRDAKLWGGESDSALAARPTSRTACALRLSSTSGSTCSTSPTTSIPASWGRTWRPSRRPYAQPVRECNRSIKSPPARTRRRTRIDAVATGHHALRRDIAGRWQLLTVRSRQGPVVRPLHARPARARVHVAPCRRAHQGGSARARREPRATHGEGGDMDVCFITRGGVRSS